MCLYRLNLEVFVLDLDGHGGQTVIVILKLAWFKNDGFLKMQHMLGQKVMKSKVFWQMHYSELPTKHIEELRFLYFSQKKKKKKDVLPNSRANNSNVLCVWTG